MSSDREGPPPGASRRAAVERFARSRTVRSVALVYTGDVFSKVISLLNTWILIRLLTQLDYASFTIFFGFANFSAALVGRGVQNSMVRYSAEFLDMHGRRPVLAYRVTLGVVTAMYAALTIVVFLLSDSAARVLYGTSSARAPILFGLALGIGILLIEYARAVYQGEERFTRFVGSLWARQVLILLALLIAWKFRGLDFRRAALAFSVVSIALGLLLALLSVRRTKDEAVSGNRVGEFDFSDYFKSFKWLIGYQFVLASFSQLDVMFISRWQGEQELAVYGVAFRYYVAGIMILSSLHAVLRPRFSKASNLTVESRSRFVKSWLRGSLALLVPLALFALFGRDFFVWLNGESYERSFDVLRILLFCVWQALAFSPMTNILVGLKRFKTLFSLGAIGLSTSLLLNFLLVPELGALGAAIATTSAYSAINVGALLATVRLRERPVGA